MLNRVYPGGLRSLRLSFQSPQGGPSIDVAMAGETGKTADIMEWMRLYDDILFYQERLTTLRAVIEV